MSKTTFEQSPATLEEKLTTYWQLVDDREQILARIAKAKNEKDSVTERIFQKVMGDYETALEDLNTRLDPLKEEIDALRQQVDQDIKQLDAAIEETEDEMSEAEFRYRVGEYDAARLTEIKARVEPRLKEARDLRAELDSRMRAMDRRRSTASTPETATASTPETATASTPETATASTPETATASTPETATASTPETATASTPETATESTPEAAPTPAPRSTPAPTPTPAAEPETAQTELEDPHRWADELQPATAATDDSEWEDPLAALSDAAPSKSAHTSTSGGNARAAAPSSAQPQPTQARGATAAPAYPNLVIRSGVHSGKIVPLLPMTMSIGREHDNNIELKDPEVARYHARVVYRDGRFHVEDLDSSTGTWVNGQHQKNAALSEGDVIRIGATELVVEFA